MSPFIANYGKELIIEVDIRRKEKVEKVMQFAERMKKIQEKAGVALRKAQKEMKWQTDRRKKEVEEWKKNDKVMLITKNLVFKERSTKKLVDQYIG